VVKIEGPFTVSEYIDKGKRTEAAIWGPDGDKLAHVHGNLGLDWQAIDVARLLASAPAARVLIERAITGRIDDEWLQEARAFLDVSDCAAQVLSKPGDDSMSTIQANALGPRSLDEETIPGRIVCTKCGVTTTHWAESRLGERVSRTRDYMPVTYVIRLRPAFAPTYIVGPELAQMAVHFRSLNDRKLDYALDIPLPQDGLVTELLNADVRIEKWHTVVLHYPDPSVVESATVCESHKNFVKRR
jgi:hypothetical protein